MFQKLRCFVFGHRWQHEVEPGRTCSASWCSDCGEIDDHFVCSMSPGPTRAAPPMPECAPPREDFVVTKLDVQAGDVVVMRTALKLDDETITQIRNYGEAAFPAGVKVVVLDSRLTLEVVRTVVAPADGKPNQNPAPDYRKPPPPPPPPPPARAVRDDGFPG